ncbi:6-pyruvoyl-tetrahydropterin synthase-related protein [Wukongibacter baidiensis]|uniref:6-pyruvoyl-tetrahydropterin synthase-related protein n=1 Tax=Wukongibacter baidiensis TaxID=1723361 RepID=UPI003D7FD85D
MKGNGDRKIDRVLNLDTVRKLRNTKICLICIGRGKAKQLFIRNLIILTAFALFTLVMINKTGRYPWGSDTYGHLFKGNILYDAFKKGKWFLNYNESWYNGIQPFRYWAPLPYYILAIINLFTNNIVTTYNVFIMFVFILGGIGWLCWGCYTNRHNLSLVVAILWFFVPDNLRVLFSEGNIPFVIVNSLIPFVFLYYYKSIQEKRISNYLFLTFVMGIMTLCHAMITAMVGISLFILACINSVFSKKYFNNILALIYAFLGTMIVSFWLYPALKGGIIGLNREAVASVMESLTYPFRISLNPLLRFEYIEVYYFGLAFAIVAGFGFLFSNKDERAPFITAIIVLLGTTKAALPVLQKLPMNQLFWMRRFTSIAMAMIILALILWKSLRKSLLILIVGLLLIDSLASFHALGFNREFPLDQAKIFDRASEIATQRIGVLDSSSFGSFPSYYIAYNPVDGVRDQIYGWAWQGATTSENIVALNTALENGYYDLMFDRALELGADTLVVRKRLINDFETLKGAAKAVGYDQYEEDEEVIIYKYPDISKFGSEVSYEGVAIGRYSSNVIYFFPKIQTLDSEFIDDYTYDELRDNKMVFLSGFKFRNQNAAESLILKLSRSGVKVIIDITGFEGNEFLDVRAEPITIRDNYGEIYYKNERLDMKEFPREYRNWRTSFLNGVEDTESYGVIEHKIINYIGRKDNDNLIFIGLNLPYYTFLTKDVEALEILEDLFDLNAFEVPHRKIYRLRVKREGSIIEVTGGKSNIVLPLAALDGFVRVDGDYDVINNLIYLKTPKLTIKIIYPYLKTGIVLSLIFLLITIGLTVVIKRNKSILDSR